MKDGRAFTCDVEVPNDMTMAVIEIGCRVSHKSEHTIEVITNVVDVSGSFSWVSPAVPFVRAGKFGIVVVVSASSRFDPAPATPAAA